MYFLDYFLMTLIFDQQKIGRESVLMENAIRETFKGLIEANKIERKPAGISKDGLQTCTGSHRISEPIKWKPLVVV
jgi:hypothetical protein